MADFKTTWDISKENAGGYADLSKTTGDVGGETYRDIARNFQPSWTGWKLIDEIKKKSGPIKQYTIFPSLDILAGDYYKKKFWDIFYLDDTISQPVADIIFDQTLDGPKRTGFMIQRVLGVPETTSIKDTMILVNKNDAKVFFEKFKELRVNRFRYAGHDLPVSNPDYNFFARFGKPPVYGATYLKGWLNRVNKYIWTGADIVKDIVKKNPIKTILILVGIGAGIFFLSRRSK